MPAGRSVSLVTVLLTCVLLATAAPAVRAQISGDAPPVARLAPDSPDGSAAQVTASPSFDLSWLRAGVPLQLGFSLAASNWAGQTFAWVGVMPSSRESVAPRNASRPDRWRKRF